MASSYLDQSGFPRGLRNNNPGNLRPLGNGVKWVGEIAPDPGGYSRFSNIVWGTRAMITDIIGDIVKDKQNTIRKLVTAYAPPGDNNNTAAYIARVSRDTGLGADAVIPVTRPIIEKIIKSKFAVELGQNFAGKITQADIDAAFSNLSPNTKKLFTGSLAAGSAGIGGLLLLAAVLVFVWK